MLAVQVRYSVEAGILLLGLCVLFGPVVAERLRIPGLVGLIAAGTLLGPNVLEWLRPGGFVATVGAAGLLYLMFVAGVELDLKAFMANRDVAVTFGLLTFGIPFVLGYAVGAVHLGLGVAAAALVGAMWASHTVVAYPEAKAAGLDRNRAVGIAVAATVITDVIALVILAVAASSASLDDAPEIRVARASVEESAVPLWAGLVLLVAFCFGVLPRATRWAFEHVLHQRSQRFVWALTGMAAGGIMGLLGGIEGLVGAFLAGIGMNPSIPARGELMERIEFFGNALLVPAFLVSVGLSIDPAAIADLSTLRLAAIFTLTVVVGKTLPALIAGKIFRFERGEIAIMATLTMGQAAATLAIAQVGIATGLFDREILNAAVVTVVATVLITSFGTRYVVRFVPTSGGELGRLGDHVLSLAPNQPGHTDALARVAAAISIPDGGLVTPCAVRSLDEGTAEEGAALTAYDERLVAVGLDTHRVVRAAGSVPSGLRQLAVEVEATAVLVPVDHDTVRSAMQLGAQIDQIGRDVTTPCIAAAIGDDEWERVVVITGHIEHRRGPSADAELAIEVARRVADRESLPLTVFTPNGATMSVNGNDVTTTAYRPRSGEILTQIIAGDLIVVPAHVVTDAGFVSRRALGGALAQASLLVVGGPGRLAGTRPTQPLLGMVASTR